MVQNTHTQRPSVSFSNTPNPLFDPRLRTAATICQGFSIIFTKFNQHRRNKPYGWLWLYLTKVTSQLLAERGFSSSSFRAELCCRSLGRKPVLLFTAFWLAVAPRAACERAIPRGGDESWLERDKHKTSIHHCPLRSGNTQRHFLFLW